MFFRVFVVAVSIVLPSAGMAGEIYGTIRAGGKPLAHANVNLQCGDASGSSSSSDFGAYRLFVRAQGRCSIAINGSAVGKPVFLNASPSRYDFNRTANTFVRQ